RREGEVLQAAKAQLRESLRRREKVIWDATNLRKSLRLPLVELGYSYRTRVRVLVHSSPLDEIRKRNRDRPDPIPGRVLERQICRMEWPLASEGHHVEVVGQ
ncbi:MAG: AAA family ATPase, partial [Verrucomicrobiota bacterium]